MLSNVEQRGHVPFPRFTGERVYMLPFLKRNGLPDHLERWQPTVDAMLNGVDTEDTIYLMIDQSVCVPGRPTRRGGVHIDGVWEYGAHGTPGHRGPTEPRWKTPGHRLVMGHNTHRHNGGPSQAIMLASDVVGCRAYIGEYNAPCKEGGDYSHIDTKPLRAFDMAANIAYAGDAMQFLHESLPQPTEGLRSVVRLNVNGWMPWGMND